MAKKSNKIFNYFKEVKSEIKKVMFPSFKQVKNNTLIVIACVLIIGAFIWVADLVFDLSLGKIIRGVQGTDAAVEETTDETVAKVVNNKVIGVGAGNCEISEEEMIAQIQAYLAGFNITYDGEKYFDAEGNELTAEQVTEIISAAQEADASEKTE